MTRVIRLAPANIIFFLMLIILSLCATTNLIAEDVSQCVKCHTSGRTLINTTREMADEIGDQPLESTESVGEG